MKRGFWKVVFALGLVGALGLELLGEPYPPEHMWDHTFFFAFMGLLGCLILSFLAKGILSPALDRDEDHYGDEDAEYDWSSESPAARAGGDGGRGHDPGHGGR